MANISKFRRVWLRFGKLPRLHNPATLKVPQDQQFLTELYVSLGSWPDKDLTGFLDQIGARVPKRKGSLALIIAARNIVTETFDVWDDGYGPSCKLELIEEVLNMPRVAKKAAVIDDLEEELEAEAPPTKKAKAAPKTAAVKLVQGRKAKAAPADEDEPEAPKKAGRAKTTLIYVEQYKPVWDELEEGRSTALILGEKGPRGTRQVEIVDALKARGRKKTTAQQLIDGAEFGNADGIVSHMINAGVLEPAE